MRAPLVVIGLLIAFPVPRAGAQVEAPITRCFQIVQPRQVGVLQNDLDCSGATPPSNICFDPPFGECVTDADCPSGDSCVPPPNLLLARGARLDLNGFDVVGGGLAIRCVRRCWIEGPGRIVTPSEGAILGFGGWPRGTVRPRRNASIDLADLTVAGAPSFAVSFCQRLRVRNVTVEDSGGDRSVGCLTGVVGTGLSLVRSARVLTRRFRVDGLLLTGSRTASGAVFANVARIANATISGNGVGLQTTKLCDVRTSTVSGNTSRGIVCGKVRLVDSIAIDNPDASGIDIESARPPALIGVSSCGRSLDPATGGSWGVCAND